MRIIYDRTHVYLVIALIRQRYRFVCGRFFFSPSPYIVASPRRTYCMIDEQSWLSKAERSFNCCSRNYRPLTRLIFLVDIKGRCQGCARKKYSFADRSNRVAVNPIISLGTPVKPANTTIDKTKFRERRKISIRLTMSKASSFRPSASAST